MFAPINSLSLSLQHEADKQSGSISVFWNHALGPTWASLWQQAKKCLTMSSYTLFSSPCTNIRVLIGVSQWNRRKGEIRRNGILQQSRTGWSIQPCVDQTHSRKTANKQPENKHCIKLPQIIISVSSAKELAKFAMALRTTAGRYS